MTPEPVATRSRRPWLIAVAILAVVVATASLIVWWVRDGSAAMARRSWEPEPSPMLSSPMRTQPVAGWRVNVTDLGLPGAIDRTESSQFGILNDPLHSRPLIGYLEDHAYFLASTPASPDPQWWVIGLDVRSGQRLFAPVKLDATSRPPHCVLNGPTNVLCVNDDSSRTAYVVDVPSGVVSYHGTTDLRQGYKLAVEQVGIYAVAETDGQGIYGIGPRAETTWFVPGKGHIQSVTSRRFEPLPQALGAQLSADPRAYDTTVFSLSDGKVVTPEVDDGAHLGSTAVYPGGFAAEVRINRNSLGVQFFDENGKRLSEHGVDGALTGSPGLPIVSSSGQSAIYSPDGRKLLDIPEGAARLVGTMLFINENKSEAFPMWRQYDLKTGARGPACDFNMSNFLGTDGSTIVFNVSNREAGIAAKARDLATCDLLWTLPSRVDSFAQVWRVNTTLIQISDDGTELFSLVAPK